jgi:hypothetical protein
MESYGHHRPLPERNGQYAFRILTLEPGTPDDEIICNLRTAEVALTGDSVRHPVYEAVSHAWGPRSPTCRIRLGAWGVEVREALFQFLQQIRSPIQPLSLWIDALCIDQKNLDERRYQVEHMDRIYKYARRSVVWLGIADEASSLAMDAIQDISELPSNIANLSDIQHHALVQWSNRPYWTHTWVVQEFLLARDVLVVCGRHRLPWDSLWSFTRYVAIGNPSVWANFHASPAYHLMRQKMLSPSPCLPLQQLLVENQRTQCADPRDKVYAMLGLSTRNQSEPPIIPIYNRDLQHLVPKVLQYCHILPKQLPRWARFLTALLEIDSSTVHPPLRVFPDHNISWSVTSFIIGRVLRQSVIRPQSHVATESPYSASKQMLANELHLRLDTATSLRTLTGLQSVDTEHLRAYCQSLQSAHQAREGFMHVPSSDQLSLVTILCSNCVRQELLLGLAYGAVNEGDDVQYFLGHDLGMIVRPAIESTDARSRSLARVVCLPTSGDWVADDPVTNCTSRYWTLWTEVEVLDDTLVTNFRLGQHAVLQLGRQL